MWEELPKKRSLPGPALFMFKVLRLQMEKEKKRGERVGGKFSFLFEKTVTARIEITIDVFLPIAPTRMLEYIQYAAITPLTYQLYLWL